MAKSTINDYVLELQWDGKKAERGIASLETRINKLAKSAERLQKATNGIGMSGSRGGSRAIPRTGSRTNPQMQRRIIEDRRLTMEGQASDKARAIKNSLNGLDMKAKGAAEARRELQSLLAQVQAFEKQTREMPLKTLKAAQAQKRAWQTLKSKVDDTRQSIKKANKELSFMQSTARSVGKSFKTAGVAMIGAYAVIAGARAAYEQGKAWENLNIQMQASFGSAEKGAERMGFLIEKAQLLGVDVNALADGYAKIGVAGRMGNVPVEDSENIFLAAAEASRAFGLSMDDTQGVMRAFSQMMGKGQVMMEELKLQLGDRMPSAMGIFAKSMGMGMQEFMDTVKAGKVGNKELARFAKYLREDIRASGAFEASLISLEAAQTRFNTALKFSATSFMGGNMKTAFVEMFVILESFLTDIKDVLGFFGDVLGTFFSVGLKILNVVIEPISKAIKGIGLLYKEFSRISMVKNEDFLKLNKMERVIRWIMGSFRDLGHMIDYIGHSWDAMFESRDFIKRDGRLKLLFDLMDFMTGNDTRTGKMTLDDLVDEQESVGAMAALSAGIKTFENGVNGMIKGEGFSGFMNKGGTVQQISEAAQRKFREDEAAQTKKAEEMSKLETPTVKITNLTIKSEANESVEQFNNKMQSVFEGAIPPSAGDNSYGLA